MFLRVAAQRHVHASGQSGFEKLMWAKPAISSPLFRSGIRITDVLAVREAREKILLLAVRVNYGGPLS